MLGEHRLHGHLGGLGRRCRGGNSQQVQPGLRRGDHPAGAARSRHGILDGQRPRHREHHGVTDGEQRIQVPGHPGDELLHGAVHGRLPDLFPVLRAFLPQTGTQGAHLRVGDVVPLGPQHRQDVGAAVPFGLKVPDALGHRPVRREGLRSIASHGIPALALIGGRWRSWRSNDRQAACPP